MFSCLRRFLFVPTVLHLSGCGTYVPPIAEPIEKRRELLDATGVLERNIKEQVFCELRAAILHATDPRPDAKRIRYSVGDKDYPVLPDTWGVQGTINLQVDEIGSLNALAAPITPLVNMQSFALGLNAAASSQATRIDKFGFYYGVKPLRTVLPTGKDPCFYDQITHQGRLFKADGSSFLLESELGIDQWLQNALAVEYAEKSTPLTAKADGGLKQDYLSYEVKFIIITSGSITPTWKLTKITANTGSSPFVGAGRTRTHDLLLTFGPSEKPVDKAGKIKKKNGLSEKMELAFGPSVQAQNANLASQIGLAVSNNLANLLPR